MFTLGDCSPKKCASEPRALFSVSRSSSVTGISFSSNHSARPAITLVLPTPPLPPIERMTLFSATATAVPVLSSFADLLITWYSSKLAVCERKFRKCLLQPRRGQGIRDQLLDRAPFLLREPQLHSVAGAMKTETSLFVGRSSLGPCAKVNAFPLSTGTQVLRQGKKFADLRIGSDHVSYIFLRGRKLHGQFSIAAELEGHDESWGGNTMGLVGDQFPLARESNRAAFTVPVTPDSQPVKNRHEWQEHPVHSDDIGKHFIAHGHIEIAASELGLLGQRGFPQLPN